MAGERSEGLPEAGIHRRMDREAVLRAVPAERRRPVRESAKLGPARVLSKRIGGHHGNNGTPPIASGAGSERNYKKVEVAECTIRRCVRKRKMALRLVGQELFVPQSYRWGEEAQVDWFEAYADIGGERKNAHVFCMWSMASGGAFHCAFPHASRQAFLEAHERAIAYFGGVFEKLRYDNLRSAVKRILRGHQREEIVRFIAFRSHWDFGIGILTPAEGHEKGGVEGEGGYFRRNHLVPIPNVGSWEKFDALLLRFPKEDEQRIIGERAQSVREGMLIERERLQALKEGFDLAAVPA